MEFAPASSAGEADRIFKHVMAAVLAGQLSPGTVLPSEAEMAETFLVDRGAIRHTLNRLLRTGLVVERDGGRCVVAQWHAVVGIDTLAELLGSGVVPPRRLFADLFVMRRSIAADAARLCAERASDADRCAITAAAAQFPDPPDDVTSAMAANMAFWTLILERCGNVAYRMVMNTVVTSYKAMGLDVLADAAMCAEFAEPAAYRSIAAAIAAGAGEDAHRLTRELLGKSIDRLTAGLEE
ncbi:FadR/GntR family transcriptional regulator [Nocardia stercoris]|uniref:FadR family transcriptional regulator n=1 Tax=Nocardia stercoris TaxID=2483361 RepID=A0A3M2L7K4_9NOCA|nr:FCD domain-containing protein [Nocardia stercoris]RMI33609.1 FadR family transcriptional regulator [Nocardia stercoris]